MENFEFPTTAKALGQHFSATIVGDEGAQVSSIAPISEAGEGILSFIISKKHSIFLKRISKAVLFTKEEFVQPDLPLTYIVVEDPQAAFSKVASCFRPYRHWVGISDMAIIHTEVEIEQGASIGPYAVIGAKARIGKRSSVGAFSYVGANVEIGEDCEIFPRVTLMDGIHLGNRVKVYPGAVIGSDGFGFFPQEKGSSTLREMPQIGTVVLEDDVRVGANTTIDRATIGETRIGQGTKIDDQVHVGHNGKIGKNCVLCGQVGLAGSVTLEDEVQLGGQVGLKDNITIGKGASIGGQGGTWVSLEGGQTYALTPALPAKHAFKVMKFMKKLPEFLERIKKIEAWIEKEK